MGSFQPVVEGAKAALREQPEQAIATFAASTRQIDGLVSRAAIRDFSLTIDEPEQLGGTDQGPNPVELVLAALGTCQEITYRLYADAMSIPLHGVSVRLEGHLDLRGFFGMDPEVRAGYSAIEATVVLDSPASDEDLARLKAAVDAHCPVLDIITNPVPVSLRMERAGAAKVA
jgi:putative redox protein